MELWGRVVHVKGSYVTFAAENPEELANLSLITQEERPEAVVQISDGRLISSAQRRKAYAIMRDISNWSGDDPIAIKQQMKFHFEEEYGIENISLGTSDMTTARYFITMLLEFCFRLDVPLKHSILSVQDDLRATMYLCLRYRKCVLCGRPADVHHVDAIGKGKRETTDHRNHKLIALCRIHHQEAHNMGWPGYSELHHIIGIKLDEYTILALGMMTKESMAEHDRRKKRDEYSKSSGTIE